MDNLLTDEEFSTLWGYLDRIGGDLHARMIRNAIPKSRLQSYDKVFRILEVDYGYQRERCKQVADGQP